MMPSIKMLLEAVVFQIPVGKIKMLLTRSLYAELKAITIL